MSMSPIDSLEVLKKFVSGEQVSNEDVISASRTAMDSLKRTAMEEQRRIIVDNTCSSCANWERDYGSKAGGWCPFPVRGRDGKKYTRQSTKACLKYRPLEVAENEVV